MIDFKNVEISYGDFVAIKDLNLSIKEGEFFTFLGPSGCGKTTTLRSLAGFLIPSSGEISIDGENITKAPIEARGISMVFQSYALFPTMTVYENLAFGLKVKKVPKTEIANKIDKITQKIKISKEQLKKNVSELSGGQQQRIALARALILEPKILCLDEPLSNLDAKLRIGMRMELKRLQKSLGITTLYVTHDQEEALTLSDRIAVFNNGFIEQVGTPYEIYNKSKSEFVCDFIGDINKLEIPLIKYINKKTNNKLDENCQGFVRIERFKNVPIEGYIEIPCNIVDSEYDGVLTKYTLSCFDQNLKYIKLNDGSTNYKEGDLISLYLNIDDVMQYPKNK
ncbi:MAG: ABC transporter ATP-binding protein [Pleomorphochaeta sp.]